MAQKTPKTTQKPVPAGATNAPAAGVPVPETVNQATQAAPVATPAPAQEAPSIFDQAVGFVLKERIEGGYVNDPRDPGGETNYGISKRSYPKVNIKTLTREDAIAIYKRDYWGASGCENMPPKIAVALFDCAVNQGVGTAIKLLQRAVGVTADGVNGPVTRAAIAKANEDDLVVQFLGWRLRRYAFTANAATFMRGWSNRVLYLQAFLVTGLKVA